MTRSEKKVIVDNLTTEFSSAQAIIACDFKGLTVSDIEGLRNAAKAGEVKVKVVKNTLAVLALKGANIDTLELTENNMIIWGSDVIGAAKVVSNYAKTNNKLVIKYGFIDGENADVARIDAFAKLPGRDELLGMLAATWMAPVANFTIGLDALRRKKEEA